MPRPEVVSKPAHVISKGTVIRHPGNGPDDEVIGTAIVLHMASGVDLVYSEGKNVSVLKVQPTEEGDKNV